MAGTLTANEEAQLLQTIEMFEEIARFQPDDTQSLEILKEAYSKLGREPEVVGTSKRIASAYLQQGKVSSAILEYESVLQRCPDDPDVQKALADIENRASNLGAPPAPETDFVEKATASSAIKKATDGEPGASVDDGRQPMHKLFVDAKLVTQNDFNSCWPVTNGPPKGPIQPFIQVLADKQLYPLDQSIKLLCDRSRLAYLPLEKYDVDVELARSFPKDVCLRWCVLPFDKMSKSVFIATANPYNKEALRELEQHTKARIVFYISSPTELVKSLKKIFRI